MSLFEKDIAQEEILGKFLSRQYHAANLATERITNRTMQHKGVDVLLTGDNGLTYKVDEKAQLHYLNKDLLTFVLEIDYLKDGELKEGWLYSAEKRTDIYAFVFSIHLAKGSDDLQKEEDIKSCEVIFVNRIKLMNELAARGLELKTCRYYSAMLRSGNGETKIVHADGFNFQISPQLSEKPVNLIVKKTFLQAIGKKYIFKA